MPDAETDSALLADRQAVPALMQAVVLRRPGGPEVLEYETVPTPRPVPGEVLVRVHAAAVNQADLLRRSGRSAWRTDRERILGLDLAGEVALPGEGVSDWAIGERVVATFDPSGQECGGTYAEFTSVPASRLSRIPDDLDSVAAAAVGLAFATAWTALIDAGRLSHRDRVVVHVPPGAVGTCALQISRWKGARTVALCDPKRSQRAAHLGADHVIDWRSTGLVEAVLDATGGKGASLLLDPVGALGLQRGIEMLAHGGRIVFAGVPPGARAEIDLAALLAKAGSVRCPPASIARQDLRTILQLLASGTLQPVIDSVWGLRSAAYAHELLEGEQAFGSVLLIPVLPGDDGHWASTRRLPAGPHLESAFPRRRLVKGFESGGGVYACEQGGKCFLIYDERTWSGDFDEEEAFHLQHRTMLVVEFDRPADRERYFREKGWGSFRDSERAWAGRRTSEAWPAGGA